VGPADEHGQPGHGLHANSGYYLKLADDKPLKVSDRNRILK